MTGSFDIVILGLSITSSWGNGHATTYRSLVRGLASRRYQVLFLERNMPWYANQRDELEPEGATTRLYENLQMLADDYFSAVRDAKLVIVGSYVPEGIQVGEWVNSVAKGKTAFYDIDTPITLGMLESGVYEYITRELVLQYDLYLSFTGGPTLQRLEREFGSPQARALYCSVDQRKYTPGDTALRWDLGYLGTYSPDRQPGLQSLLLSPAESSPDRRFVVAGPQYPNQLEWPQNVERIDHLAPPDHSTFYSAQRFTLNLTREAMRKAGYSPSVRLFEAAACGTPIISDWWTGLDSILEIGTEVLVAEDGEDVFRYLRNVSEQTRRDIGGRARERILREHTSEARAEQLEHYWMESNDNLSSGPARRHRRSGQSSRRMAAWMEPQFKRESASTTIEPEASGIVHGGDIHESTGAGN